MNFTKSYYKIGEESKLEKNFSDSHLCATERARRYPRHPLWGIPQQSFRTDKARLPQSVEASLLFDDSAMILWVKDGG